MEISFNYQRAYYLYALARRRRRLAGQLRNNGNIELDPISTERLRQLFAVYGCNGTEFFLRNFTTVERRNGNGRLATEWWKPDITEHYDMYNGGRS